MCAVDDVQNVQHFQDPESKIFLAALKDVERRHGVDKGFVVLSPSGIRLFSMTCHSGGEAEPLPDGSRIAGEAWDGHGLLRQGFLDQAAVASDPKVDGLRQALERYAGIPRAERLLPEGWQPGLRPRRDLPLEIDPDDVVLRLTSRRLPAGGLRPDTLHPSESGLWRWNQDWLVLDPSAARRFLAPTEGGTAVVPEDLVRQIAGYYVDSTGGQAKKHAPGEIREAVLHSTVVGTGGGITSVQLEGRVASPSFAGRVFGYAQYHREGERFVAFQLAAVGTGGKDGKRQPLGFLFVLSRGPLERSYPALDLIPFDGARERAAGERSAQRERPQRERFVPSRPTDEVVAQWRSRLLDRLRRELAGRRGPSIELPSLGGVTATINSIDERDTLSLRLATGGAMQSPWSLLGDAEHRNLALALRREFDPDDHCLAGFFLLLGNQVQAADQELSKAGAAGEAVRALFVAAP